MRHHLLPAVTRQVKADPELAGVDFVEELKNLFRRMRGHLARAEAADNWLAIRAFHQEARHDLELLGKAMGVGNGPRENPERPPTVVVHLASREMLRQQRELRLKGPPGDVVG
ncbi:MAG: hypothetical protein V1809_07805 [Planctomycetota bacterium]